jgi:hypothetical protein
MSDAKNEGVNPTVPGSAARPRRAIVKISTPADDARSGPKTIDEPVHPL